MDDDIMLILMLALLAEEEENETSSSSSSSISSSESMDDANDEYFKYVNDRRKPCKYRDKCYQKNPDHHQKFKHPPKKRPNTNVAINQTPAKKQKTDLDDDKNVKNDINTNNKKETISSSSSSSSEDERQTSDSENHINKTETISSSDEEIDTKPIVDEQQKATPEIVKQERATPEIVKQENPISNNNTKLNEKQFIKQKFLVDMPEDFYQFWEFCKRFDKNKPENAFATFGLKLVGPYDVLAGKFMNVKGKTSEDYLVHWRYYYDPPELQTVIKGDDKIGFHIGYFRDSPKELPSLLVSNNGTKDGVLIPMGDNIFAAINNYLDEVKKTGNPFAKMNVAKYQVAITAKAKELNLDLAVKSEKVKNRDRKVVTKTFNKIGLVVPYNRKTQLGYRELTLSDKDIKTIFDKLQVAEPEQKTKLLSTLQPVLTYASIAADECDFGTGLELGWDIISHGVGCLNLTALKFLSTSYQLLGKHEFAKIAEAHMNNRKKGTNLSII